MKVQTLELPMGISLNEGSRYYMAKNSTTRHFTVYRLFDEYYSMTSFSCEHDLSLKVSFSVHDIIDDWNRKLVPISQFEYDTYMEVYDLHVNMMVAKTNMDIEDMVKVKSLTNPFWRANELVTQRKICHG